VQLSELFSSPDRTLVLMHFMFGGPQSEPCPMCTMWADGYDAVMPHLRQRIDYAMVVAGDLDRFVPFATSRGWDNTEVLSAEESTFKIDHGSQDADGNQSPAVSVFTLGRDGAPMHHYTQSAQLSDSQWRGLDLLTPVWNYLDLTPEGRGEWFPSIQY
jgi:predicted dithiol-disulfide oxidoreductase (DUF899 family)